MRQQKRRVMAVASGGGHWEELMLLRAAWEDQDVRYATTLPGLGERSLASSAYNIPDCNRTSKLKMIHSGLSILFLISRIRPEVIVTTGALPGLLAIILGKFLGMRTIWIDSVANAEEMSLAGQSARKYADLWLTQWPGIAQSEGATYVGSVL